MAPALDDPREDARQAASLRPRARLATHEVFNQPEPRAGLDGWFSDAPLRAAVSRLAPGQAERVEAFAEVTGSPESIEQGREANRHPPELRPFDRAGRRIDEAVFHPAYHALMAKGMEGGYSACAWTEPKGGHVAHAAMMYLMSQVEPGVCCPMTMTYAAVPALRQEPALDPMWAKGATAWRYDGRSIPAAEKAGLTFGMAMTEKQGGSDVRANQTKAERDGDGWRLTGHKWFCSAPMSDAFLTLAYTEKGLTCFLMPRWTPDGERNAFQLMRLKDKLGNKANASSEIEYHGAFAWKVGEEGRGVNAILEMVHHTRLDTAMAPAGLMRRAVDEAAWWARGRSAFQKRLIDQPLMTGVLADLALDWMGALAAGMRVAAAFDASADDPRERAFARIAVAIAKFWSNKRCPLVTYEAMECLGGVGYVEESPMPWLYREAPLNSIWEGSGNVICLDILRTLHKAPEAGEALRAELMEARGADPRYDAALAEIDAVLARGPQQAEARWFAERLALALQASELLRHGDPVAAAAFCDSRLAGNWGRTSGTLPASTDAAHIAALI